MTLSREQQDKLHNLRTKLEDVNAAIRQAVDAGMSVELVRSHRHHQEGGFWGDIMSPSVVKAAAGK